jgi:hypothetical protein
MRNYPNIEKSGFHKGEYVGYGNAKGVMYTFRIVRDGRDGWKATVANPAQRRGLYDVTGIYQLVGGNLGDISSKLNGLAELAYR